MRRASQAVFLFLALAASARAQAQADAPDAGFGDKGHLAIAGERMFGYVHVSQTQMIADAQSTQTFSSISLLGSPVNNLAGVYTFPRIAFDGFIAPSISIGGSATYFRFSAPSTNTPNGESGFLVAPRIGYTLRLAPTVWVWPRAGITYVRLSADFGSGLSGSSSVFAATVEAPLVLALAPRAFVLIGPTVDLGLSGSRQTDSNSGTNNSIIDAVRETDIGLQAGLMLCF